MERKFAWQVRESARYCPRLMALDANERRQVGQVLAALSPLSQKDLSLKAGWHKDRLRTALDRGKNSPPSTDELLHLAELVGVPEHFVVEGFGSPLHERVNELRLELTKLSGLVNQLRVGLTSLAGEPLQTLLARQAPGETDHPGEHEAGNG